MPDPTALPAAMSWAVFSPPTRRRPRGQLLIRTLRPTRSLAIWVFRGGSDSAPWARWRARGWRVARVLVIEVANG